MPRWVIVLLCTVIPFVVITALGGALGFEAGTSYGRMPMPGQKEFTLDPGEVTISYEEGRNYPSDETMPPPPSFPVRVTDPGGDRVKLYGASGSVTEGDGFARRAMRSFEVEERGTYTVVAGRAARGVPDPQVTLGEDTWDLFKPWLIRAGIAAAAGFAIGLALVGLLAARARDATA